jgi:hypothetical protein
MKYVFGEKRHLPNYLHKMIATVPQRGGGLHQWLFRTALQLQRFCSERETIEILRAKTSDHAVKPNEIEDAVRNSRLGALTPNRSSTIGPTAHRKWPCVNEEQRQAVLNQEGGLVDLLEKSPIRCEETPPATEEIIDQLMPKDCLLCAGRSQQGAITKPRSEWRGSLSRQEFIVPSPMRTAQGSTKEGKISYRSLNNVGPRRFLVIDQDTGSKDEQAAVINHLARVAPLALVVATGGRGTHAWFYCSGKGDSQLWFFMRMAVLLGACKSTWSPIQLVRMPGGIRDGITPQPVLLFNPGVVR